MKAIAPLCLGVGLASCALAQDFSSLAVPWTSTLENTATVCRVGAPAELLLVAPPNTDLFIAPGGDFRVDKSPRVVFRPEGPFILTAKVQPEFRHRWDAGVLLIYSDAEHFAKFPTAGGSASATGRSADRLFLLLP